MCSVSLWCAVSSFTAMADGARRRRIHHGAHGDHGGRETLRAPCLRGAPFLHLPPWPTAREEKEFTTKGTEITEEARLCVLRVSVVRPFFIYRHGRRRAKKKDSPQRARRSRRKRDSVCSVSLWWALSSFTAFIYKCGGASRTLRLDPALRDEAFLLSPGSFHSCLVMCAVVKAKGEGRRAR